MMKKVLVSTLFSLAAISTSLLSPQAAKAATVVYCNSGIYSQSDAADHSQAYADGYRQGQQSFREGQAYQPRTVGGDFGRGFEDGYFNRPYTGQQVVVANTPGCIAPPPTVVYGYPYVVAPPPVAVYNNPEPFVDFGIGLNFGRGYWGHYGWGHRR
jgi:hypothetical protein